MKFKIAKLVVVCCIVFISSNVFAQKDFQGQVYYESKRSVDMTKIFRPDMSAEIKERITSRMKRANEKTFILTFNKVESIYKEQKSEESFGGGRGARFSSMMASFSTGTQYKNVNEGLFLENKDFFGKQFLIKDDLPKLAWKMTGETKKIGDYMCFKAIAKKIDTDLDIASLRPNRNADGEVEAPKEDEVPKEIEVVAWYTIQIPVNQGPGEYWGLPGLILEVTAGETVIYCTKIVINPTEKEAIVMPEKGKKITREAYDKIAQRKMEELQTSFSNRGGGRPGGGR